MGACLIVAAWPAQIDTAKVARKLALTGAAKGTAGRQQAAAAAAAAGLDSPAAAVGKRKAGAAAVGGFQLPGLATESEWQHRVWWGLWTGLVIGLEPDGCWTWPGDSAPHVACCLLHVRLWLRLRSIWHIWESVWIPASLLQGNCLAGWVTDVPAAVAAAATTKTKSFVLQALSPALLHQSRVVLTWAQQN